MEKEALDYQTKITKLENNIVKLSDFLLKEKINNHALEESLKALKQSFIELDYNLKQ